MRICLTILFLYMLAPLLPAQSRLDLDNGIMGYALGSDVSTVDGILKDGKVERLARYRPIDDSLRFNDILTRKVRLFFWEGKMHSIEVKLLGAEADKMLVWLKQSYGEGKKEDAMGFRITWEGQRVRAFWDQNLVTKDATLTLMDDQIHAKYYEYMKRLE